MECHMHFVVCFEDSYYQTKYSFNKMFICAPFPCLSYNVHVFQTAVVRLNAPYGTRFICCRSYLDTGIHMYFLAFFIVPILIKYGIVYAIRCANAFVYFFFFSINYVNDKSLRVWSLVLSSWLIITRKKDLGIFNFKRNVGKNAVKHRRQDM